MANQLAGESSRYLQQHADNPVDWYPWGEEAFEKARQEDKPIFLSIGYSACHWCHVMAHESFEDEEVADFLNEHFVSIKVDREERPDLDQIYMSAVQAMTGSGGWPMSVFITPEGKPFYGGTYFPPEPRYQMPSFLQVLEAIADAWETRREALLDSGEKVAETIQREVALPGTGEGELSPETIETAYQNVQRSYDASHGGWGHAPKFPQSMALEFLLRYHYTTEDERALAMLTHTLEAMARGGIYDQLGGGFHRYAVDAHWVVPHFEKMLYDNALLARVYLHAWQVTRQSLFRTIVEETLDYVAREMTSTEGGFYATQDADTEGEEGKFYVWTIDEIREVLEDDADRFIAAYGASEEGNFEGQNILVYNDQLEARADLQEFREALFSARAERARPGRDEKVLTSWNGLMLATFAEAARALVRKDYQVIATRSADFLLNELRTPEGRLWHVWKDGEAKVPGFLDDYTHLIEGLLALYQTTYEPRFYTAARELADLVVEHFAADGAGFYDTAADQEKMVVRPRSLQDNAVPSGNAMAATVLLKLGRLSGEPRYEAAARASLRSMQGIVEQYPLGFGQWLVALESALATPTAIAVIGDPADAGARALLAPAQIGYHPHRYVAAGLGDVPALLEGRSQQDGQATAYVCRASACRQPVTEVEALEELLK